MGHREIASLHNVQCRIPVGVELKPQATQQNQACVGQLAWFTQPQRRHVWLVWVAGILTRGLHWVARRCSHCLQTPPARILRFRSALALAASCLEILTCHQAAGMIRRSRAKANITRAR